MEQTNERLDGFAWVSITDPGVTVENSGLKIPRLNISFWDIISPTRFEGVLYDPPSMEDAQKILDFILDNPDKDIIVNCMAGISRSGAVCQFLEDYLDYEWIEKWKARAYPNYTLYKYLVESYGQRKV